MVYGRKAIDRRSLEQEPKGKIRSVSGFGRFCQDRDRSTNNIHKSSPKGVFIRFVVLIMAVYILNLDPSGGYFSSISNLTQPPMI